MPPSGYIEFGENSFVNNLYFEGQLACSVVRFTVDLVVICFVSLGVSALRGSTLLLDRLPCVVMEVCGSVYLPLTTETTPYKEL